MASHKSHSGASKRFKVSASGKILHKQARRRHLLRKRSTKCKRHLRVDGQVKACDTYRIKELLIV